MLARISTISHPSGGTLKTPLLVPSFSSKGFPKVAKILETMREVISGPILVSAYDMHYQNIDTPLDFASLTASQSPLPIRSVAAGKALTCPVWSPW